MDFDLAQDAPNARSAAAPAAPPPRTASIARSQKRKAVSINPALQCQSHCLPVPLLGMTILTKSVV